MVIRKKTTKEIKHATPSKVADIKVGPQVVLITGAAGYVGAMLCDQFSENPDVREIIAIDKDPMPEILKGKKKIAWIAAELSEGAWEKIAENKKPEVIIHSAWQTKELYEQKDLQYKLNVSASEKVFDFVFNSLFVKKLIYISSASVYGILDNNKKENLFMEGDLMRESEYLYGKEKREVELMLANKFSEFGRNKTVFVLRPTTIMGPRAKYMVANYDLFHVHKNSLPFVPFSNEECGMQYLHEDDLTNIVAILTFNNVPGRYEVFNLAPDDVVMVAGLASITKKEKVWFPPFLIKLIFFLMWHITQGKIPTGVGTWKFLCYPIYVDGGKITRFLKYPYLYSSMDALTKDEGRYEYSAPVVVEEKQSKEKKNVSGDK